MTLKTGMLETQMRQALEGDAVVYVDILCTIVRILRPYVLRRVSDDAEADDVLQEILLSIHKARHTYDGKRPLMPWIYAIARYRIADYQRATRGNALHHALNFDEIENSLLPQMAEQPLLCEYLEEEIILLPRRQAIILRMMHYEGYSVREVAARLGMKESAIKVAAHRAYKILRKKLIHEN